MLDFGGVLHQIIRKYIRKNRKIYVNPKLYEGLDLKIYFYLIRLSLVSMYGDFFRGPILLFFEFLKLNITPPPLFGNVMLLPILYMYEIVYFGEGIW